MPFSFQPICEKKKFFEENLRSVGVVVVGVVPVLVVFLVNIALGCSL